MQNKSFAALLAFCLLLLTGCSTTKDKWVNREYHKLTAHFNAYFNGLESYDEAVANFEATQTYDFEKTLPLYYWPNESQAPSLFAAMDRALEKSAKVIKGHSMVFSGKQKNDYVIKAYLLIARSRFYKHELIQSLEATSYIADQFDGLEIAREEVFWAKLLAAQTHIRMGNGFSAEALLDDIYTKRLPKDQLFAAQKGYAYYHLSEGRIKEAQEWVELAATNAKSKSQKVLLTYINAQLYAKLGMGYESALAYQQVLDLHPNDYDITFSAQIKRAENFDVYMEDISVIEKQLNKMLRDDKNISYRDQIYYVWALKRLDLEEYPEAERLLRESISSSVDNPRQKGKSYLSLATIEFDFKEFVNAQAYYDSAITALPANYPGLDTLQRRTEVLNELVGHLNTIALQDSLQGMYGQSEATLREKFESYIEAKKLREAEAARLAEIAAMNAANNALLADAGPTASQGSGQWYFYNPSVRAKGVSAFKRKWGDRKLEDHWRTTEKPFQGFGELAEEEGADKTDSTTAAPEVLPTDENSVDYYMARLLGDDEAFAASELAEAQARAEIGFLYKDGLKDAASAEREWDAFMADFSGLASVAPKVWYGQYLLFSALGEQEKMALSRTTLLDQFPNSPYAALLRGDALGPQIPAAEQAAYDLAFDQYNSGNLRSAQRALTGFLNTYPKSVLRAKAALLQAYIVGTKEDTDATIAQLQVVVNDFKGTEEATRAAQILSMLVDVSEKGQDPADVKGKGDTKVRQVEFADQANAPHKFIIALPAENAKINELRNALADFNKEHFKFDNLRIQNIFYDQNTQLVIVSGLRSKAKAEVYKTTFSELGTSLHQFYPSATSAVFYINNPNFGKVYRDKVLKEYIQYFNAP